MHGQSLSQLPFMNITTALIDFITSIHPIYEFFRLLLRTHHGFVAYIFSQSKFGFCCRIVEIFFHASMRTILPLISVVNNHYIKNASTVDS